MSALALPSRREEAFRYTDTDALARVWPVAVETILVPAGTSDARQISNLAGSDDVVVHAVSITLEAGASFTLHLLNAGGRLGRYALDVTLHEGASFTLNAAQIGSGAQTLEIVSTITHAEPGATSRQTVRSILCDGATGTYLGKVAVARDAQQTDSEQSVRAMLLDRHSTANAVPELEIFADDVKCAHGCAVGRARCDEPLLPAIARAGSGGVQALAVAGVYCRLALSRYRCDRAKAAGVLDAMMRAGGADYATVHRGVYARSANMTLAYEAARRRVASFIGGRRMKSSSCAARPRRSIWWRTCNK
jgi:Fe-S cluster assembly protein SufD